MARKISEPERVEAFFIALARENKSAALVAYERITLILRTLGVIVPQKRARRVKTQEKAAQ